MHYKEIVVKDEANYLHRKLVCLSCSIAGLELLTQFPEAEADTEYSGFTQAQVDLVENMAATHARKHTNPQIRLYSYTRS